MNLSAAGDEQQQLDELRQRYSLRKLIYVNSAKHGYSEFEIDKHMALFGDNNEGKTASLAGLKLALFPEESLTHCERKFRFSGKEGNYSKEDSYRFYFPSSRSYIVTEAENPDGIFCMILYRAQAEWAYGRFFVQASFDSLRPLFWDTGALGGDGDFAAELELPALRKTLSDLGAVQVSDSREIAEYLYGGYRSDPGKSRFCLFPLNDGASREAIEAFRNLYQIAFDIGQSDKKTLPRAIATIIEMQRGRKEERLSADLSSIQQEYDKLTQEKSRLDRIENQAPYWQQIEQNHSEYLKRTNALREAVAVILRRLAQQSRDINDEAGELQFALERAVARFNDTKLRHDDSYKQYQQTEGALKSLEQRLLTADQNYKLALNTRDAHPGMTPGEIHELLQEQLTQCTDRLQALESEAELQARTQACIARVKSLSREKQALLGRLETNEPGLLDSLSADAAAALYSLSEDFSAVPPGIAEELAQAAEHFGSSLIARDGTYSFGGTPLPSVRHRVYDLAEQREQWRTRILRLDDEIQAREREITENNKGLRDSDQKDALIAQLGQERETLERDARLIIAIDVLQEVYQNALSEQEAANAQLDDLRSQLNAAQSAYDEARVEKAALEGRRRELEPKLKELQYWQSRIARSYPEAAAREGGDTPSEVLTEQDVRGIEDEATALQRLRATLSDRVKKVLAEGLLEGIDPFMPLDDDQLLNKRIARLAILFAELGHKRELHARAVSHHNTHIDNQLQELREAKSTVERFVKTLNDELNRHRVSNLSAIRLRLDLNARFSQLMAEMARYDLQKSELIAEDFYQRLASFCSDFFDSRRHRLNLEMIIAGIRYEYQRQGSEKFDTKGQSGGTTSTTTALILSILLNRISPQSATVGVPIIIDEIGTLDSRNTRTAINTVAEHGFAIFCATPKPEATIMEGIGRWLAIDRFKVRHPQVADCHACVLLSMVERFGETETSSETETEIA